MSGEKSKPRLTWRSLAIAVALAGGSSWVGPVLAQDTVTPIHLSAQPLGQALNELARQTGANIVVSGSLTEGRQAPALGGNLSVAQALDQLLKGTDLEARSTADGTFIITQAPVREAIAPVLQRVLVTGSNIRRADAESSNPVQVIGAEEIARLGKSSVTDILRTVTANAGNSFNGNRNSGWATGSGGISLRGLSLKNTLILLNGRRVANYAFPESLLSDTFVDINALPVNALDRIEILKDGASAIYGSDAVAGVVNLITKQDYQGASVGGSTGFATEGGAEKNDFSLFGGLGNLDQDGYNVFVSFKGFQGNRLDQDERDLTKSGDYRHKPGGALNGWSGQGARLIDSAGVSHALLDANGNCPDGMSLRDSAEFDARAGSTCAYNLTPETTMVPGNERYQLFSSGVFKLGDGNTELFYDALYSRIHGDLIASNPYFTLSSASAWALNPSTGLVDNISTVLPGNSPNNVLGQDATLEYTFLDQGIQNRTTNSDFYRLLSGLRGNWRGWNWEGAAFHSTSLVKRYTGGGLVNRYALLPAIIDGSYNLTNPELTSPAVREASGLSITKRGRSKINGVDLKISNDIYELDAGPIGFAAGLEWRQETLKTGNSEEAINGSWLRPSIQYVVGERKASAGYAEFNIPLLDSLEVQLAGRADFYDDVGNAFSPKYGFRWQPVKQLMVRGSASRGFRAPTLSEGNADNYSIGFTSVADPHAPVPGSIARPTKISSGGDDLDPERTKSYNLGLVLSPDGQTNLSVDFYRLEIDKVIMNEPDLAIVARNDPSEVIRASDGTIQAITSRLKNLAELQTSGVDIGLSRRFPSDNLGEFGVTSNWTYIKDYRVRTSPGTAAINYAGNNGNGMAAMPKTKGNTQFGWDYGNWKSALTWSYTGSYEQVQLRTGVNGIHSRVKSYNQFDAYLGYEGIKDLTLYINVENLENKKPPYDPWGYSAFGVAVRAPYDVTQYDLIGRYITVGFNYKFF